MKAYTFLFLALFALACSEDDPRPENPWVGTWRLDDPVGPMVITFHVAKENAGTHTYNAVVEHPAIPEQYQHANNMFPYDKFEDGDGFGRIEIVSRTQEFYYRITLIYNQLVVEEDPDTGMRAYMDVYDVQVDIEGQEHVVLPDRSFRRIRAN